MSEMTAHWAWPYGGFMCGECGYSMDTKRDWSTKPMRYIVWCVNNECKWHEQRFEVQRSAAAELVKVDD